MTLPTGNWHKVEGMAAKRGTKQVTTNAPKRVVKSSESMKRSTKVTYAPRDRALELANSLATQNAELMRRLA